MRAGNSSMAEAVSALLGAGGAWANARNSGKH